ncbi:MAG: tRNA-dihydrouridine synthase family protein [Planctomycetota bacterium]
MALPRAAALSAPPALPNGLPDGLPFTGPWLLAPMEGVTDSCFRDLVLARHDPRELGGAFTEFVRVLDRPLSPTEIQRHLRQKRLPMPVGVQLMGADLEALAGSARSAVTAGAPLVDLNFGCPAKGALRGCAGAAVLRDPPQLERIVRVCHEAVGADVPVTAKIRAGFDDAELLLDLAAAAENGGAAMLTVHCRTRQESYQPEVDWSRIARAVQAVSIPVCGNGGIETHADLERMRQETGCALVMVGQAALSDPWVFSGRVVDRREAASFLFEYAEALMADGASRRGAVARVKQLLRGWHAGGLIEGETDRAGWLRETDGERFLERLATAAGVE